MFIKKDMHPARKVFRLSLLVLLGASVAFFTTIASYRIAYKGKRMDQAMQDKVFHADVLQHRALAYISNDAKDMEIAINLLKAGFFSPIYSDAGLQLLQEKAAEGYAPAADLLNEIANK